MRARGLPVLLLLLLSVGGCEEKHGFLKVDSDVLLADDDRLACGEAKIAPKAGGLVEAFVTLKPQDCTLTYRRNGDWFAIDLCNLHIDNNRITSVYLSENARGGFSCAIGSG